MGDRLVKTLRGMRLPPGYNSDALLEAASVIEQADAEAERLRGELEGLRKAAAKFRADYEYEVQESDGESAISDPGCTRGKETREGGEG